jgi:hypothetical protein
MVLQEQAIQMSEEPVAVKLAVKGLMGHFEAHHRSRKQALGHYETDIAAPIAARQIDLTNTYSVP